MKIIIIIAITMLSFNTYAHTESDKVSNYQLGYNSGWYDAKALHLIIDFKKKYGNNKLMEYGECLERLIDSDLLSKTKLTKDINNHLLKNLNTCLHEVNPLSS